MKGHVFKEWVIAVRAWSFPASVMPVAVTLAYLAWKGAQVDWLCGVLAVISLFSFQGAMVFSVFAHWKMNSVRFLSTF